VTGRRVGRRPGTPDTRVTILAAARSVFAARGYDGASIRRIATEAAVDPALVHHYFGSKEALFRAVVALPIEPETFMNAVFADGPDAVPERLARSFLAVWDDPISGPSIAGVIRSAIANEETAQWARDFFAAQIVPGLATRLADRVEPDEIPFRVSLVATQLHGLAVARYLLRLEPLASTDTETVVAAIGPTIRRYLFEELSGRRAA
jgi:AcrR family transcriptional regulator